MNWLVIPLVEPNESCSHVSTISRPLPGDLGGFLHHKFDRGIPFLFLMYSIRNTRRPYTIGTQEHNVIIGKLQNKFIEFRPGSPPNSCTPFRMYKGLSISWEWYYFLTCIGIWFPTPMRPKHHMTSPFQCFIFPV